MNLLPKEVTDLLVQLRKSSQNIKLSEKLGPSLENRPKRLRPIQKSTPQTVDKFWERLIGIARQASMKKKSWQTLSPSNTQKSLKQI